MEQPCYPRSAARRGAVLGDGGPNCAGMAPLLRRARVVAGADAHPRARPAGPPRRNSSPARRKGLRRRALPVPDEAQETARADIVTKSRAHHGAKKVHGPCTVVGTSFVPFAGAAKPLGVAGL